MTGTNHSDVNVHIVRVPTAIKVLGFADDSPCPVAGGYLESFDHEAENGRGYGTFTREIGKAMVFAGPDTAFEFWRRVPKCRPLRPDGKPNRPLTATTIELIAVARAEEMAPRP